MARPGDIGHFGLESQRFVVLSVVKGRPTKILCIKENNSIYIGRIYIQSADTECGWGGVIGFRKTKDKEFSSLELLVYGGDLGQ